MISIANNIGHINPGVFTGISSGFVHPSEVGAKIYCDFTDSDTMTFNATKIATIANQGTDNDTFAQATDARRPIFVKGVGATFNFTTGQWVEKATNLISDDDGSLIVLVNVPNTASAVTASYIFSQGISSVADGNGYDVRIFPADSLFFNFDIFNANSSTLYSLSYSKYDDWYLLIVSRQLIRVFSVFNNSIHQYNVSYNINRWFSSLLTANRITIGRSAGSQSSRKCEMTLKEVIYVSGVTDLATQKKLCNYLIKKNFGFLKF